MWLAASILVSVRLELTADNNYSGVDADGKWVSVSGVNAFKNGGWNQYKWDGKAFSLKERVVEKNYRPEFSRWREGDGGLGFELEEMPSGDAPIYSLHDQIVWPFKTVDVRFYQYKSGEERDFSIVYSRNPWKNVGVVWADGRKGGSTIKWKGIRFAEVDRYWTGRGFVTDWVQVMDSPGQYAELSYMYDGLDRSHTDRQAIFVWKDGKRERAREFWRDPDKSRREFSDPSVVCFRTARKLEGLDRVEIQERPVLVAEVKGLILP